MNEFDNYDEGSDIENWENEQVFQDHEGDEFSDEELSDVDDAESLFGDAYEDAFGFRPEFSVNYLSNTELLARIENLQNAHATRRFILNS